MPPRPKAEWFYLGNLTRAYHQTARKARARRPNVPQDVRFRSRSECPKAGSCYHQRPTRGGRRAAGIGHGLRSECPFKNTVSEDTATSHIRMVPSTEPEAIRPLGSAHKAPTVPTFPARRAVSTPIFTSQISILFSRQAPEASRPSRSTHSAETARAPSRRTVSAPGGVKLKPCVRMAGDEKATSSGVDEPRQNAVFTAH